MGKVDFYGGMLIGFTLLGCIASFAVPQMCNEAFDRGVRSVYMEAYLNNHGRWEIKADELEFTWRKVAKDNGRDFLEPQQ